MSRTPHVRELRERGWVRLSVPCLTAERIDACYAEWRRFFCQGPKEKFLPTGGGLDGYFPKDAETAKGFDCPDPKEFFHFYRDGQCPDHCYGPSASVFQCLAEAAVNVFEELAREFPILRNFSTGLINSRRLVMRIAYYEGNGNALYFAAPHEDINFLTLIPKATRPGLEVLGNDGLWEPLQCSNQQCLVLVGDMLAEALQGGIPAKQHRVIASPANRLALSFFLNPDDDVILSPRWTAGQFLMQRLREIGIHA